MSELKIALVADQSLIRTPDGWERLRDSAPTGAEQDSGICQQESRLYLAKELCRFKTIKASKTWLAEE